jgi:hypothetical protein
MRRVHIAFMLVAACSGPRQGSSSPPPPPPPDAIASTAPPIDAAASGCAADQDHCCLPDGRIVVPGGCQPVHRDGEYADVVRNPDGTCEPIECLIRCLPAAARIATPDGDVPVSELAVGDAVWSVDARGARIEARVLAVSSVPVLEPHEVVEVVLADGRTVRASAGHPLAGPGTVGALALGATLDGSTVTSSRILPYTGDHTWDLLPDSETGAYWADGVLLGSTLAK